MKLRHLAFQLHRYLGLAAGLVIIIVGLTGSLLVFEEEINHFLLEFQFGKITPQQQQVSILSVIDKVKAAYPDPSLSFSFLGLPQEPDQPIQLQLQSPNKPTLEVIINPYTGKILGDRLSDYTIMSVIYNLHYSLLAGDTGIAIVGIAALLLFILSITGIILWPGWRKLISGFKIKWNGHIKRTNFDIHKVVGIITAVFLALTAFTGFFWNFYTYADPVIYAVTFSPKPIEPESKPIPGKPPLALKDLLQRADAALPGAVNTYISFPTSPKAVFMLGKRFPEEKEVWRSRVYLDQYTGEVLHIRNSRSLSVGDEVMDAFNPLHYGTFGGLATRILYVLVGLAPTILSVTGFVMWRYRYRSKLLNSIHTRANASKI
ncbi:PepSY domain-containing protein [Nostoc sp. UCD121]|uniref:PepSY-associated TM helix domain-containing protein n=1 Tax=unclassified Nostoc TaxID=2593658 RepID=UPI001628B058|nr:MULTISPECIES: PepSY-associated TM helix domain-containing protein [unclassified Nostoc]MBC1218646.1 PepSY domain-containing protein [Nostoc sp. UCD120]MBC1274880.1 PepSY domain-containing protein [Nostoc sp. UCD121]MBC1293590.1 PepSY domain-containing protein [Nostoc sp. UCD122]